MIRDAFYYGKKPNIHPREKFAVDLQDARRQATTENFWIINEFCDYSGFDWDFDFDFLPDEDVWSEEHNNVWPSYHQKDSGTWLCPKQYSDIIVYRSDVTPLKRIIENDTSWKILEKIDTNKFDLSWHPDPTDPPFIYKWGCKFYPVEVQSVLEYHTPFATEIKYMDQIIELLPNYDCLLEVQPIDKNKFDISWRPDPREPAYIYVWGNKWIPGEIQSTLEYHVPNAVEYKYMDELLVVLPDSNWKEYSTVDRSKFDMSWRPDPREPAFIYVWGNKYVPGETSPTLEYHTPGAIDKKFMSDTVEVLPEWDKWEVVLPVAEFDFSWRPNPTSPPYVYVWGNKHIPGEIKSTVEYHVPGAVEKKYMPDPIPVKPDTDAWVEVQPIDKSRFDMTWRPNPMSPPYIYVWGNKYIPGEIQSTLEYHVSGAVDKKFMPELLPVLPDETNWLEIQKIDRDKFDMAWRPNPASPPYIYVWGNKYIPAEVKSTIEYHVPGARDRKFMPELVDVLPEWEKWQILVDVEDFDFAWRPDPTSPPYIYQFGTILDKNDGPRYIVPDNTGEIVYLERKIADKSFRVNKYRIETTLEDLVNKHPDEMFWAVRENIDYTNFDFDWRPEKVETEFENKYVHVFGSADSEITQTYFVNSRMYLEGHTDYKFVENRLLDDKTLVEIFVKPDMFFIDRSNTESQNRYEQIKQRFPSIQKTRYLNSWVDTINRCINKSTTQLCWIISSEIDYTDFDFGYYPNPWQMTMVHVFGTQWTHWGNTYLVNRDTFTEDTKYIKIIEHLSNLNFVKTKKANALDCLYDIFLIDHGNDFECVKNILQQKTGKQIKIVKYDKDYLKTLSNLVETVPEKKENFVWVCSSICDYNNFDFSYICDPFSREHLHVFPSNRQKFGDTFLVNVNSFKSLKSDASFLEDIKRINFNQHQKVSRLPAPLFLSDDTHVEFKKHKHDFPYAIYTTKDNSELPIDDNEPLCLWSNPKKNITILATGGTRVIVPKEANDFVDTELYDYPYIKTSERLLKSKPLDIVFFSNGEVGAEQNYEHLYKIVRHLPNRLLRVDNVVGRVASQHAAAEIANTPWYFLVNAKLKVSEKFDFSWQPDRLQMPKHYIFHASNPVNGLIYGHQAIVANNKNLTLNTIVKGLDFTMDSEHEVVPIISGVGHYNTSAWDTWRTAFREVIKLKFNRSEENKERLEIWTSKAVGDYSQYSLKGAKDALDYYDEVDGNLERLMFSYDWKWLREFFDSRYNG